MGRKNNRDQRMRPEELKFKKAKERGEDIEVHRQASRKKQRRNDR